MITDTVKDYRNIKENINKLIDASGYRIDHIVKKMNMDRTSFYYKRKSKRFSLEEIERLLEIIKVEELEDEVLNEISLRAEKNEEFVPLAKSGLV